MGERVDALWRVLALVWQGTLGYVALAIVGIIAFIWMVLDVLWQLITGRDGLDSQSAIAMQVEQAFEWSVGQTVFALTGGGDGQFRWFWT